MSAYGFSSLRDFYFLFLAIKEAHNEQTSKHKTNAFSSIFDMKDAN